MAHQSQLIESNILDYLKQQEHKDLLRFITCGSVDDGKSTLIGRLLYESKLIYEDQLDALKNDSKKVGTQGDDMDFALLVDGLASEREQGITIDVAYRFFSTDKRKFIVADTPGHEQYTRNMATGASTAELAILMVDARHGIMTQTKRHSTIVHLLGVKQIVLAINKMDLVDYDAAVFDRIVADYSQFAATLGIESITAIPVSALKGDNITDRSSAMGWYTGPCLIEYLESVPVNPVSTGASFSMPVQWVNRPHLDFRGFAGQITTGKISVGDTIDVLPANVRSHVASIVTFDGELEAAYAGQSVTITLRDEIDVSRGDVMVSGNTKVQVGHRFHTTLLWMSHQPMVPQKSYWIKTRAKLLSATIQAPEHRLNINTLAKESADTLSLNEIGDCICEFDQDVAYEPYTDNPHLGSFIIIDRQTNHTVGMGLIQSALSTQSWADQYVADRAKYWMQGHVTRNQRHDRHGHQPLMIILTGTVKQSDYFLAGSTLESALFEAGINAYRYGFQFMRHLDSDSVAISQLRQDMVRQLMDIGYAFMDAGMVFITAIRHLTATEITQIETMAQPFPVMVIHLDDDDSFSRWQWQASNESAIVSAVIDHIQPSAGA